MYIKFHGKRALALLTAMVMVCAMTVTLAPSAKAAGSLTATYTPAGDVSAAGGNVDVVLHAAGVATGSSAVNAAGDLNLVGTPQFTLSDTGDGSLTVQVSVPPNSDTSPKTYTVSFSVGGTSSNSVTINQAAASATPTIIGPNSIEIDAAQGSTASFTVTAANLAAPVSVTVPSGITVDKTTVSNGDTSIKVTVSNANTSTTGTNNYSISFGSYKTVQVVQKKATAPGAPVITSGQKLALGGTLSGSNFTNTNYYIKSIASGATYISVAYTNSTSIKLPSSGLAAGTYYLYSHNGVVYSAASTYSFSVATSAPSKPNVTSGQNANSGGLLKGSGFSGSLDYYIKSTASGATYIKAAYYSSSNITLPTNAASGTYYLYAFNGLYSSASTYSFSLSGSTITRPVVASGQLVGQGGILKVDSYTLPSGYEFVAVPYSGTKTYYKCTSSTGSAVTALTMPVSIPEGTYNLCVRVVDSTAANEISDTSVNTFVINNSSPTISSTSPLANATGVSPLTPFSITFNKGMKTSVGTTIIRNTGSGGDPSITKTTWSNDDKTVTYTLSGMLANTTYTATIYNTDSTGVTAFTDTAGNLLNTQTVINFTTGAAATYASGVSTVPLYAVGAVSNNALTANIDDTSMDAAVTQAIKDEVSGYSPRIMLTLSNLPSTAVSADVTVSTSALYPVINRTGASLAISAGHLGTLTFNHSALSAIYGTGTGTVTFSVEKLGSTAMTSSVSNAVGTDPAYEFGVTVGSRTVTSFGTGQVTVSIPHTLAYSANPSQLVGYRVSSNGMLTPVMGSYQPSSYSFDFRLKSFSTYVIKYNAKSYTDVYTTDWFSTAVDYTAARGLMDVFTTGMTLEPERKITRAEFVVVFMKAYGIEPSSAYTATQFEDVNLYSPHAEYLRTAKALGLIRGTNAAGTTFNPDGQVTRDQFFTLTYNALTVQGLMPATDTGKRITNFSDAGSVGSYATAATDALVKAGVVAGSNGRLDPAAIFTRSQMAQAMYNLISQ